MAGGTVERLDPALFEPVFADIEPILRDVNVIRGLSAATGGERFIRARQLTQLTSRNLITKTHTQAEESYYLVDSSRLHGEEGHRIVGSALWAPAEGGALELKPDQSYLHVFNPEGRVAIEDKDSLFTAFDEQRRINAGNSLSDLAGWFDPDIVTSQGMQEFIAKLLESKNEAG